LKRVESTVINAVAAATATADSDDNDDMGVTPGGL